MLDCLTNVVARFIRACAACRVTITRSPTQRPTVAGEASRPGRDWPDREEPEDCSGPNNKQPSAKQAITIAASQLPSSRAGPPGADLVLTCSQPPPGLAVPAAGWTATLHQQRYQHQELDCWAVLHHRNLDPQTKRAVELRYLQTYRAAQPTATRTRSLPESTDYTEKICWSIILATFYQ